MDSAKSIVSTELSALRERLANEAPCIRDEAIEIHKKLRGIMRRSAGRIPNQYAIALILAEDAVELERRRSH